MCLMLLQALLSGCLLAGFAIKPARAELRTTRSAIACLDPGDIPAAEDASKSHDRVRMDKLGCFPVRSDTATKRIGEKAGIWHAILDPNGADPMEAWGRPSSFRE
jgi:hypothetical protein